MPRFRNIAFVASDTEEALAARARLAERYGDTPPDKADAIVALGGDGLMLQTMHRHLNSRIPIYGMNRGRSASSSTITGSTACWSGWRAPRLPSSTPYA